MKKKGHCWICGTPIHSSKQYCGECYYKLNKTNGDKYGRKKRNN